MRALIGLQHLAKRAFDIVASVALLGPAAIVIGIATVLVRLRSPGPAIFRQVREGKNGTRFTLYKIRTMRTGAERVVDGSDEWARYRRISNDQRVVPGIGKWLRESSLDELPQLWNVLRGDMSIVGPRPLELEVLERCAPDDLVARRSVRPGITGLWQVSGRSEHDIRALCAIDAEYVRTWSLLADASILLRTPGAVLSKRGAY